MGTVYVRSFAEILNGEIEKLKLDPEYEPGKEVSILVPMKSKIAKLDGAHLDNAKISWLDQPYHVVRDKNGDVIFDPTKSSFFICKVTGKIR